MNLYVKKLLALPEVEKLWRGLYAVRTLRLAHPAGEFDSAGRWYPDASEMVLGSFDGIRRPTRRWPYPLMLRARTKDHCKLLVLAYLFREPDYAAPPDVDAAVKRAGESLPENAELVARAVLPAKWRSDPDGRTLALAALTSCIRSYRGGNEYDRTACLVLADWLEERDAKAGAKLRSEIPVAEAVS
jgi:hypothetical protein